MINTTPATNERAARYALAATYTTDPTAAQAIATAVAHHGAHQLWAHTQPQPTPHDALRALEQDQRLGYRFLIPGDEEWPTQLDTLPATHPAPLGLWVTGRGHLADLSTDVVALIGSRAASTHGHTIALELSTQLHTAGRTTLASSSYGIDAAVHQAALTTNRPTIAALPCGIDIAYPRSHAPMLAQIAEHGVIVTTEPPGAHPTRTRLQKCGHLIAALAAAVIIIEASPRSHALGIAAHATELGRPLGAVPGPTTSTHSAGPNHLINHGAHPITTTTDITHLLHSPTPEHDTPDQATP